MAVQQQIDHSKWSTTEKIHTEWDIIRASAEPASSTTSGKVSFIYMR